MSAEPTFEERVARRVADLLKADAAKAEANRPETLEESKAELTALTDEITDAGREAGLDSFGDTMAALNVIGKELSGRGWSPPPGSEWDPSGKDDE